jgi:hypothetical protein
MSTYRVVLYNPIGGTRPWNETIRATSLAEANMIAQRQWRSDFILSVGPLDAPLVADPVTPDPATPQEPA